MCIESSNYSDETERNGTYLCTPVFDQGLCQIPCPQSIFFQQNTGSEQLSTSQNTVQVIQADRSQIGSPLPRPDPWGRSKGRWRGFAGCRGWDGPLAIGPSGTSKGRRHYLACFELASASIFNVYRCNCLQLLSSCEESISYVLHVEN